jgi:hypothetical protein
MLKRILGAAGAAALIAGLPIAPAAAKSVGGCPAPESGFSLVAVSEVFPEGLEQPSLDGNGDGLTCIKLQVIQGVQYVVFRDNTVQGP